ncbi:type II toxin-antitoxin system VapC family toxin [Streptomyces sp. A3M-1-3]|uniref:type II toxin-antitoxin system VapC family toxin n=1 Tax=Streptomyces sp. A3M-1-3 TaxID=2962044 RepID=UPI0020B74DA6|nr:type II toxin-antitoxin system VapC family toxin [Streptomyces sp. A3M-1-3]MCP3822495.1 type II toxin-antitoxin system VapC family toxin [Streptomyces sp. A3M-1-3]
MILCDVNVLVYAYWEEDERYTTYHPWLQERINGDEPVAFNSTVASGFLRVVTNPRIFERPSTPEKAFAFLQELRKAPNALPLREGPRHWEIFENLCRKVGARGNLVPDAYFAALAIESGSTFYSADRGFARFPGLKWSHPLED